MPEGGTKAAGSPRVRSPLARAWGRSAALAAALTTLGAGVLMCPSVSVAQFADEVPDPCDPLEGPCGDTTPPGDPVVPEYAIAALNANGEALTAMQDDLLTNFYGGLCATVEYSMPTITQDGLVIAASSGFFVLDPGDGAFLPPHFDTGEVEVTTDLQSGTTDIVIVSRDESPGGGVTRAWTLTQSLTVADGVVTLYGTMEFQQGFPQINVVYEGGWTYDPNFGPMEHPASDPEFHVTAAEMLRCGSSNVAGGVTIGDIIGVIGGVVGTVINYFRDLFIPYTPPTTCTGAIVTGSCDEDEIPCQGDIADMAKKIGDIPGVSAAFKKCMKGRFGCGGSSFPKLRIACDDSDSCGPCALVSQSAGGCNAGGSTMWYCQESTNNLCTCVDTVFHEAAHSCGIGHSLQYLQEPRCDIPNEHACEVGIWFKDEFADALAEENQCCIPCSGQLDGPSGGTDAD